MKFAMALIGHFKLNINAMVGRVENVADEINLKEIAGGALAIGLFALVLALAAFEGEATPSEAENNVTRLIAGDNITLNPENGLGVVTINATGTLNVPFNVTRIIAGTRISISPENGYDNVTINVNDNALTWLENHEARLLELENATSGGGRTVVVLSADNVNNNPVKDTLQDCGNLTFPITAGVTYRFNVLIAYNSDSTSNGSRWTINGPADPTLLAYKTSCTVNQTTEAVNFEGDYQLPSSIAAKYSLLYGNVAIIVGIITPSQDGTLAVQFASELADTAITAKAGSILEVW